MRAVFLIKYFKFAHEGETVKELRGNNLFHNKSAQGRLQLGMFFWHSIIITEQILRLLKIVDVVIKTLIPKNDF